MSGENDVGRYRAHVQQLLRDLVTQNMLAEEANRRIAYHVGRIDRYTQRRGYAEHSAREKKQHDFDLTDAVEEYRKRCSEVSRISSVIRGIAAAVEFLDR